MPRVTRSLSPPAGIRRGVTIRAANEELLARIRSVAEAAGIPVLSAVCQDVFCHDVVDASIQLDQPIPNLTEKSAIIIAVGVAVRPEVHARAQALGVRIFKADLDNADALIQEVQDFWVDRVIPDYPAASCCRLQMLPEHVYARRNPIIVGVRVLEGYVQLGTHVSVLPPAALGGDMASPLYLGQVEGIRHEGRTPELAGPDSIVSIKVWPVRAYRLILSQHICAL
jgi:translation initiation factor IF-2